MFRRLRRTPLLGDHLPFEDFLSPQAMLLTDGSACAAFEVDGIPAETAGDAIARLHEDLCQTLRNVADGRLTLAVKLCRGLADPAVLPPIPPRAPAFAEALLLGYGDALLDGSLYSNRLFLCAEWAPAQPAGKWAGRQAERIAGAAEENAAARLASLERVCAQLASDLSAYGLRRLGVVVRDGIPFNEMAEAEALAATGVWRPVPVTTGRIGDAVFSEDITFHHEHVEIRGPGWTTHAAHLGFREYPATTRPGVLGPLAAAPFRCTLAQTFRFLERSEGERVLTRRQNFMRWSGDKALSQQAELSVAADHLLSGRFVMGEHNMTLAVFADGDAPDALPAVVNAAWKLLGRSGCTVARENRALMAAWLSLLAGGRRHRVRPGAVSSRNFAGFAPLHGHPAGPERSRWGAPVAITRTSAGTPYRFHWHDGEGDAAVGNTLVTGTTGGGKTTTVNFIAACTVARIRPQGGGWVNLDHKRGAHPLVLALGGSYSVLGAGEANFAPLKALDADALSLEFLTDLLRGCIRMEGWRPLTDEEDRRLALGVRTVMEGPPEQRSVAEVRAFLPRDEEGAWARLRRWCRGEELGWVIDAPRDRIDMAGDVNGFDTTLLLDNPRARGPALAYLFHRIERRLDGGRPLLITVDEGWRVLEDDAFRPAVNRSLRTIRSKNSILVFISQSPRDAVESGIAAALVEQCPNQMHFFGSVRREDFVQGLKRTDGEFAALMSIRKGDGRFLLCKGTTSSLQQVPLHSLGDDLAVLSASQTDLTLLDRIPEEDRRDPARFLAEFHRLRKAPRPVHHEETAA